MLVDKIQPTGVTAIGQIFRVINEQSQASFDDDFNWISYYNWTGGNGALSPAVNNAVRAILAVCSEAVF